MRMGLAGGGGPAADSWRAIMLAMSTEELLAQVLKLPRSERARVAGEILSTLEEPEDVVASAWVDELERRSREIAEGRVQPIDWDTAREEILQELERRRARKATP